MIKQIDRVINDLRNQVVQFKRGGGNPICAAVIGINQAESTTGYEGDRPYPTTGKQGFLHPFQEAPEAERRLRAEAAPEFDELVVLRFKLLTRRLIHSSGWISMRPGWIMQQRYPASAPDTNNGFRIRLANGLPASPKTEAFAPIIQHFAEAIPDGGAFP